MLLAGLAKVRIVRIERGKRSSIVCIVIERIALRLLHNFVIVIVVVSIYHPCYLMVSLYLDDRRSYC
jgi:hypothetical protein